MFHISICWQIPICRCKITHFPRHAQTGGRSSRVVGGAANTTSAPSALETFTPASRRESLTAPQTLSFGPSGLRPSCPNARDCSTAAPLTARQSGKPACPAILRFPYELCGFGVALQIVLQKGVDNLIHPGIVADAGIVHP